MIRIEITAAAYAALVRNADPNRLLPAQPSPTGGFYLWLDKPTLTKLTAFRGRSEGYSEAIIRLGSELEAA